MLGSAASAHAASRGVRFEKFAIPEDLPHDTWIPDDGLDGAPLKNEFRGERFALGLVR